MYRVTPLIEQSASLFPKPGVSDLLPNSEIHALDAGHFAWERAPERYGSLIVDWVTGGFQRLGGTVTA